MSLKDELAKPATPAAAKPVADSPAPTPEESRHPHHQHTVIGIDFTKDGKNKVNGAVWHVNSSASHH